MSLYNAANRKDVRRLEKQARVDERSRKETVTWLMGTMAGREWLYNLLSECHVFVSSFSLNAYEGAFREGERNVGLRLLNDVMQTAPDDYVLMMREANARRSASDTIADQRGSEDGEWGDQGFDPTGDVGADPEE